MSNEQNELAIDFLPANTTFNNYLDLCNFLGIPSTGGNVKKATLLELGRHCFYTFEGRKIKIGEVYGKPLAKEVRENSKWVSDAICEVVMTELLKAVKEGEKEGKEKKEVTEVFIPAHSMGVLIGLCNENYHLERAAYGRKLEGKKAEASTDFYQMVSGKLPSIVKSVLDSLSRRYMIHYVESFSVDREGSGLGVATNEELAIIKDTHMKVFREAPFNTLKDVTTVLRSPLRKPFYSAVNKELKERGFTTKYKGYQFFVTDKIGLRLDYCAKVKGVMDINKKMKEFLIDKMETKLESRVFLGGFASGIGKISPEEQRKTYEITFRSHVDSEIGIEEECYE